jgi:hypothetical protein
LASTAKQIFAGSIMFGWSSTDLLTGMMVDAQLLLVPIRRFESDKYSFRFKIARAVAQRLMENAKAGFRSINVIASAAKQSIWRHKERRDCFVAALLAMTEWAAHNLIGCVGWAKHKRAHHGAST